MLRVQFRLRWLMAAVAIVALALGARIALRRRAESFAARSAFLYEEWVAVFSIRGDAGDTPERRRRLGHIAALRKKYKRAALRPWLPVAPDPPEPE